MEASRNGSTEPKKTMHKRGEAELLGILVTATIIGLIYYFFSYAPHQAAQQKAAQDAAQQASIQQAVEAQKAQDEQTAALLNSCLTDTQATYHQNWVGSCQTHYNTCINAGVSDCSHWNPDPTSAWNCALPDAEATRWDNGMQQDKQNCFQQYPQK
jgi:hypothetical protein